jgi:hypothetical protein
MLPEATFTSSPRGVLDSFKGHSISLAVINQISHMYQLSQLNAGSFPMASGIIP